jgi:WD40 repeat protein
MLFAEHNAGELAALSHDGEFVAAALGSVMKLWRLRDHELLETLTGTIINDLAFDSDNRLAIAYGALGDIRFWDPHTGRPIQPLRNENQFWASRLAFNPDPRSKELATTQGRVVSLWDLKSGTEQQLQRDDSSKLSALVYADDGTFLATASNSGVLTVWDTQKRKIVFSARRGEKGVPIATSFLPKDPNRRIVYTRGQEVILERWQKGFDREDLLLHHPAGVRGVAFLLQDGLVIAAAEDGSLTGWDVNTGRQRILKRFAEGPPKALQFSPDGHILAVASPGNTLRLVDAQSGADLKTLTGFQGEITALAFNAEGSRLAAGSTEKWFYVWDLSDGVLSFSGPTDAEVRGFAFASDGLRLAVGSGRGLVQVWDLRSQKRTRDMGFTLPVVHLAFQPDGPLLASLHSEGVAYLWNVVADPRKPKHSPDIALGVPSCLAFSPDGRRLATADEHGSIYLSDPESGRVYLSLRGSGSRAVALAFSPDGHRLACAHADGSIRIWNGTP